MQDKTEKILQRFEKAKERRQAWESLWQECYEYTLPQKTSSFDDSFYPTSNKNDNLFDGTAPDCVDQLASSLLARLTPPWESWFGFSAGSDLSEEEKNNAGEMLDNVTKTVSSHFFNSNFSVEIHQCYLDLVTAGTACLLFEEAPIGEKTAFKFSAIPLCELVLEEGITGRIDTVFRKYQSNLASLKARFQTAEIPQETLERLKKSPEEKVNVIETVIPKQEAGGISGYEYLAFLEEKAQSEQQRTILRQGIFSYSPFIVFRWSKVAGDVYGRSPVMKTLPDIKTANKVVELVLKNATIAVTGIWQADDDGVLNPANVKLVPGTIIPKAVGSKGLSPLEAPGKFDVSQLVLDDLRARIKHALLADKLGQISQTNMTATEVLERSAEMARILGATYGRLQSELLTPLVIRASSILKRRGEIADFNIDGRIVELEYRSPLAKLKGKQEAADILNWVQSILALGINASNMINIKKLARILSKTMRVPKGLLLSDEEILQNQALIDQHLGTKGGQNEVSS